MKRPRIRFTIGGLMLLILLVGAAIGIRREIRARRTPSAAELRALSTYKIAVMLRELTETMVGAYEQQASSLDKIQGDLDQVAQLMRQVEPQSDTPNVRGKGEVDPARTPAPAPPSIPNLDLSKMFSGQAEALARQRAELERLRADEAAKRAEYERERAARLGWLGRWVKP